MVIFSLMQSEKWFVWYLMLRGWLLYPFLFILLAFRAKLVSFPFWWFSSMPFIQLVLVPLRSEVWYRNLHQVSYPNFLSIREITALDHFSNFSSLIITLTACLLVFGFSSPHKYQLIILVIIYI